MDETLIGLNHMLFQQMQILKNPKLKGDELKEEFTRTTAMVKLSIAIVKNGELMLSACRAEDNSAITTVMSKEASALLCLED